MMFCVSIGTWAITVTVDNSSTETNANNYYVTVTSTSSDQWWPQGLGWQVVAKNVTFTGDYSGLTWADAGGSVYNQGGMNSRFDFSNATGVTFANLGTMFSAYNSGTSTYPFDGVTKVVLPTEMIIPSDISALNRGGNLKFVFSTIDSSTGEYQIYVTSNLTSTSDLSEDITSSVITALQGTGTIKIVGDPTAVALVQNWLTDTNSVPAANITAVPTKDPIEYDSTNTCVITINRDYSTDTVEDLIGEAQNYLSDGDASTADICTIIINGTLSATDLSDLGCTNAAGVTRIDLSEATLASGASVDDIQVPTSLVSLVLPPNQTVKGTTLATTLSAVSSLQYAYSPTSDAGATVPDYIWVNQANGLNAAYKAETPLLTSIYIKVAANDNTLTSTDMDMRNANILGESGGLSNLAFLDLSEAGLTPAISATYKCPDNNGYTGYRIILPNNRTGDQMAIYAANPNVGSIAAVYSYTGTELNILEINDGSYSPAALADGRIMRSNTTQVNIVSGYHNGQTYAQFGTNLLAALNNMGNSTSYPNSAGLGVRTISIETTSAAPNTLTFTNPVITTLNIDNLSQTNAQLNVDGCTALTTLDLTGSSLQSVDASITSLTTAVLSGTVISGATDFSGATALATFTTTDETSFGGALNLTSSALTSFTSAARFSGDITLNASSSLASINVSSATFTNTTSKIHIDESSTENSENTAIINALKVNNTKTITLPTDFGASTRVHPYTEAADYIEEVAAVAAAVTYEASDMVFHDNNTNDGYYTNYRYWYQGTSTNNQIATLGTSATRTLHDIIAGNSKITPAVDANADLTSNTHVKIKVVGPLTANSLDSLKYLNCTTLDLSDAVIETGLLKTALASDILHANTKFLVLPDTCSREHIVNGTTLANLSNVYSVIAVETTDAGRNLTSWSRVSGALQPAVVSALRSSAQSWTLTPDNQTQRNIYTSDVSNFKALKISGLINSYDLSKGGQKLDEGGHLSWAEDVVETTSQKRTQNGAYTVYGPFSACFLLTEIDLKNAYFEPLPGQTGLGQESVYFRFYYSDMTLSALNLISTATYKVVIPQNSKVREVPADFMNCSTNIRAICIPSNIQAIRARAFWTIDYVWTTPDAYATSSSTADPEGSNTRLDNGAKLSVDGGTTYIETSALVYDTTTHKYKENENFLDSYYTADYSSVNGGGTYTFGSTLKLIETGAFANTQPNVKDVYVLNTTAPECHVDAFNTVMYTGNGGYNSAAVSSEGIITREAYYNGRWITMLHYPRQTSTPNTQRYTDPTRSYSIATGERDGKGAILYFPNQSEFIRAYQQGTYGYIWNAWNPTRTYGSVNNEPLTNTTAGWSAEGQTTANSLFDAYTSGGTNHQYTSFYKVDFDGETITAPSATLVPYYQVQYGSGSYSTGNPGNLYPQSEIDANSDADSSGEMTEKDYRGWHQFVLMAYAANTVLEEEPYRSYITDNEWWTICPEFDITRSEAALLFGQLPGVQISSGSTAVYPKIHKLRYVRREYSGETIYLNFSQDLATYKEDRSNTKGTFTRSEGESGEITAYSNADQHGSVDSTAGIIKTLSNAPAGDDVVMSAGVPYLIKPNLPSGGLRQYRIFKNKTDADNYNSAKKSGDPYGVNSETLYAKIKLAQEMSGSDQRAMVKSGAYTVPVFVSVADGEGVVKEAVEVDGSTPKTFRPDDDTSSSVTYHRSADRHYTFVGTLYNSFLPHYCYFLGWDSANSCAKFYYHNGNFETIDNEMRWANGTGVIVPVLEDDLSDGAFKYDVAVASDMAHPAQWSLQTTFKDDSFVKSSGGSAKQYLMDFNSPDLIAVGGDATGIVAPAAVTTTTSEAVYDLQGRKVADSMKGLPKGVYVVGGKKFVVK